MLNFEDGWMDGRLDAVLGRQWISSISNAFPTRRFIRQRVHINNVARVVSQIRTLPVTRRGATSHAHALPTQRNPQPHQSEMHLSPAAVVTFGDVPNIALRAVIPGVCV